MTTAKQETKKVKVVKKATKKIDVKTAAKDELSTLFAEFLKEKGIDFSDDHTDYAFTKGTLVVHMDKTDVQVKFITPRASLDRYQQIVYEYVEEDELEELTEEVEEEIALV